MNLLSFWITKHLRSRLIGGLPFLDSMLLGFLDPHIRRWRDTRLISARPIAGQGRMKCLGRSICRLPKSRRWISFSYCWNKMRGELRMLVPSIPDSSKSGACIVAKWLILICSSEYVYASIQLGLEVFFLLFFMWYQMVTVFFANSSGSFSQIARSSPYWSLLHLV